MSDSGVALTAEDSDDPFEAFDRSTGAGTVRDPYPEWARLRSETLVVQQDPRTVFGLEEDVAINALLDRLLGLRLDPAADDVHSTGQTFRSPRSLPVVFD